MSANAILLGTVDHLRDAANGLGLGSEVCDEQPDGQPPPNAGQLYYAIHEGEWSCNTTEYLGETFGVELTITLRASSAPVDRHAVSLKRKLRTLAEAARAKIHSNYDLMNKANAHISGAGVTVNGFVEPLRFRSGAKIIPRGPDWFWAEGKTEVPSGLSITLVFGGAARDQKIEGQT